MPSKTKSNGEAWRYDAELIQACNCDWGCPCNFGAKPSMGFCEGGYGLHITDGLYAKTSLNGLKFAWFAKWPGPIHHGGGTASIYVEEKATKEQRDALAKILMGKAGGLPWTILAATIDNWLEPKFAPFEWKFEGVHSSFKAGTYVQLSAEPIRNPVTGADSAAKVVLPKGFVLKEAEVASSRSFSVFDRALKYAYPGKYVAVATVHHSSS